MKLRTAEDRIFARLKNCRCAVCLRQSPAIVSDGTADPAVFTRRANLRLLFILKEANDSTGRTDWDMRDFILKGGRAATWNNLSRWVAAAHGESLPVSPSSDDRSVWLRTAAFANLKKRPGGATAVMKAVEDYAVAHREALLGQFALYKPQLTIACGTHPILHRLCGEPQLLKAKCNNGLSYFCDPKLGVVIDFYHPNSRKTSVELLALFTRNFRYHARRFEAS